MDKASYNCDYFGPTFGEDDFDIYGSLNDYDCCQCKQQSYEKKIRDTKDKFLIEDYEVFHIIKKK